MNRKQFVNTFAALSIGLLLGNSAWSKDDWEYWDKQCAPRCATAGPDGKPDGGCMEEVVKLPTLGDRQRKARTYNEALAKQLIATKQISSTPVKPTQKR